jgi:predicted TIM-barrel fold metal-dependent hydrolase
MCRPSDEDDHEMRTIGTEEHLVTDEVVTAWDRLDSPTREETRASAPPGEIGERLREVGQRRIAAMDDTGLDVQVISLTSPGLQALAATEGARLQVETNDRIAELVNAHADRFQGFAALATAAPAEAAHELERAVTKLGLNGALLCGRTRERNLDHPDNWPIFEAAASLRAPLYIHPQVPQPGVRAALYAGFDDEIDGAFAAYGIGWHYEAGVQFLRLALAGVFDRFPELQVLLGHWGEVVLFYLDRADGLAMQAKLPRPFSEYVRRNVYVTPGGVYSPRYLRWAVEVAGVERILFATDYPYRPGPDGGVEHFLQSTGLERADQERIAAGNWDALVAGIRR